ncbi:hypothetical protein AB8O38_17950 [Saccharomonospora xinjiangensis]|uniref:hypothetical protein n=1 Tax=Saccharomonospora xinjiangensis TaxID=75294 RepID=UPI00350F3D05
MRTRRGPRGSAGGSTRCRQSLRETQWTDHHALDAVNPTAHAAPQQSEALVASLVESKSATVGEDGGLEARDERVGILGAFDSGTSFVAPSVQTLALAAQAMAARLVS